jgi:hypothetical protein
MLILRKLISFISLFSNFIKKKNRAFKNAIRNKYQSNRLYLKFDSLSEYNMTLKHRAYKKKKKRLSLICHFFIFFLFFSFLMFYDMADEDQYFFVYEFHKWW